MTSPVIFWLIPTLYLLCFVGLAYSFIHAIKMGASSYASVYTEQTSRQFADIFFFIPPRRILELAWTTAAALFVIILLLVGDFRSPAGIIRGLVLGLAAALLTLNMPRRVLIILKARRLQQFNEQLVDALMTMSNALRAGASILQAFEHIVKEGLNPIAQEFALFLQQTRVGVKFEEALDNLAKRVNSEDLSLMINAIEIARQTGGNLTEVFEKISATIRERMRIQARVRTLTAQGRMQGIVVGLMPIGLVIVMFVIDPLMMNAFFTTALGLLVGALVLVLEVVGALLIRKIIDIDV